MNYTVKTVKGKKYVYSQQSINGKQTEKYISNYELNKHLLGAKITKDNSKINKITELSSDEQAFKEANKEFVNNAMEFFYMLWCDSGHDGWSHHGLVKNASDKNKIDAITSNINADLQFANTKWLRKIAKNLYYLDKKSNELEAKLRPGCNSLLV